MMHSPRAEGDGISEQRGDKVSKYQVAFLPLHLPPTPEPYLLKQLQGLEKAKSPTCSAGPTYSPSLPRAVLSPTGTKPKDPPPPCSSVAWL